MEVLTLVGESVVCSALLLAVLALCGWCLVMVMLVLIVALSWLPAFALQALALVLGSWLAEPLQSLPGQLRVAGLWAFVFYVAFGCQGLFSPWRLVPGYMARSGEQWQRALARLGFPPQAASTEAFLFRWLIIIIQHILVLGLVTASYFYEAAVLFQHAALCQVGHDAADLLIHALRMSGFNPIPWLGRTPCTWDFLKKHLLFHHSLSLTLLIPLNLAGLAENGLYKDMVWWLEAEGIAGMLAEILLKGLEPNAIKYKTISGASSLLTLFVRGAKWPYTFASGLAVVHGQSFGILPAYALGMSAFSYFNYLAVWKGACQLHRILRGAAP
ncbi:unnamed protein product [Symbiodinium natans]|uniref:Uncharacterized protein n=1 Tax=Symbiodinium natans TaxID=878477 RepID=A0A812HYG8_9DINO|nr:unnamed protein product [Symbiodinium natans]